MKGLAWMAILSAVFIVAALGSALVGFVLENWFGMAYGGVCGLIAIAFAMLALRE